MTDRNDELLRLVTEEASTAVRSHPEWITRDKNLREAAMRLESERRLTPDVVAAFLESIFRARISPGEMARLRLLLEAGEGEHVIATLRDVFRQYIQELGFDPPPATAI